LTTEYKKDKQANKQETEEADILLASGGRLSNCYYVSGTILKIL